MRKFPDFGFFFIENNFHMNMEKDQSLSCDIIK